MLMTCLGSESAGNGYILKAENETLLIESGLKLSVMKQMLNFDLSNVVGCLQSHAHQDHSKYSMDYMKAGINVYTSAHAIEYCKLSGHRLNTIKAGILFQLGQFSILPFDVPHDVPNLGFLISHPETGKILFATDCAYIPHRFVGLSQIMLEVNYEDSIMTNDRAIGRHLSLDNALKFLQVTDLSRVHNIILLHLSATNSDSRKFVSEVQQIATNATVVAADRGVEINLSKYAF